VLTRHLKQEKVILEADALLVCPGDLAAKRFGRAPMSLDELARDICKSRIMGEDHLTIAPEHTTLFALAQSLRTAQQVEDPSGLARIMLPAVNMLYREGIDLASLAQRKADKVGLIAAAAAETRTRLRAEYRVARADAIATATERLHLLQTYGTSSDKSEASAAHPLRYVRKLVAYGFAQLIPAECRFLDRLAAPGSVIYLPYTEESTLFTTNRRAAAYFESRGWDILHQDDQPETTGQRAVDAFLSLDSDIDGLSARSCPTLEDEVRTTLREIKARVVSGEFDPARVALVARSEAEYGPIVKEIAFEYGLPIHTHYSVTLLETRFGQWLLSLLKLCEPCLFPFESTARLAQHPLAARLRPPEWAGAWKLARKDHTRGAQPWKERELLLDPLIWETIQPRRIWCKQLRYLTEHTFELRTQSLERPQDIRACEVFLDALQEYEAIDNSQVTRETIVHELTDLMRLAEVSSDVGRTGIALHTPLSLFGAELDHLYVLGAADGELPRPVTDDALLDFHDRTQLRLAGIVDLESAAGASRRETLSFYSMLLAAVKSITFSYSRLAGSSEARPSPFLKRMGLLIERCERLTSVAASESEELHYLLQSLEPPSDAFVSRAVDSIKIVRDREKGVQDSHSGILSIRDDYMRYTFSPAQITTFGQCSYRWYAQRILHLADPEEAEDDLATNLKGLLFHDTLNRGATACKHLPDIRTAMLERLTEDFDAAAAEIPELLRLPGWKGRRPELLTQLEAAIRADWFLVEGYRVQYTEHKFNGLWNGLRIAGRLDRLDEHDGNVIVVDYKTSGSAPKGAKDAAGELKLDVQLPIYMTSGSDLLPGGDPATGGYYYSLTNATPSAHYNMGLKRGEKVVDAVGLLRLAELIKSRIAAGAFPVDPDGEQQACTYCELDMVCRRGPYLVNPTVDTAPEEK